MPQVFQVLKCYKCLVFQVHQTKKSNKWQCKLCGEKQSLKRHYGLGTGKECRLHVQKLNGIRGEVDELNESIMLNKSEDSEEELDNSHIIETKTIEQHIFKQKNNKSKWSSFIDKTEPAQEPASNENFFGNTEVVLEIPVKKRQKFKTPKVSNKSALTSQNNIDLSDIDQPKYQQTTIMKPKLAVGNAIPNVDSFKVHYKGKNLRESNKLPNVTIPEKENDSQISQPLKRKHNDLYDNEDETQMQGENPMKVYMPPTLNKNSKWARYADETVEAENTIQINNENLLEYPCVSSKKSPENAPNNLFTLCDESELDAVLDL